MNIPAQGAPGGHVGGPATVRRDQGSRGLEHGVAAVRRLLRSVRGRPHRAQGEHQPVRSPRGDDARAEREPEFHQLQHLRVDERHAAAAGPDRSQQVHRVLGQQQPHRSQHEAPVSVGVDGDGTARDRAEYVGERRLLRPPVLRSVWHEEPRRAAQRVHAGDDHQPAHEQPAHHLQPERSDARPDQPPAGDQSRFCTRITQGRRVPGELAVLARQRLRRIHGRPQLRHPTPRRISTTRTT